MPVSPTHATLLAFFVWYISAGEENAGQDPGVEDMEGDQLHCEECAIAPRGLPADGGPLAGANREPPDEQDGRGRRRGRSQD